MRRTILGTMFYTVFNLLFWCIGLFMLFTSHVEFSLSTLITAIMASPFLLALYIILYLPVYAIYKIAYFILEIFKPNSDLLKINYMDITYGSGKGSTTIRYPVKYDE